MLNKMGLHLSDLASKIFAGYQLLLGCPPPMGGGVRIKKPSRLPLAGCVCDFGIKKILST